MFVITKLARIEIQLFIMYLKKLVQQSNNYYLERNKKIDLKTVGYVASIEKRLMIRLSVESKDDLLHLIEENDVVDFTDNPRRMIIVDPGDKFVCGILLDESQIKPESYYVYTHIKNDSRLCA